MTATSTATFALLAIGTRVLCAAAQFAGTYWQRIDYRFWSGAAPDGYLFAYVPSRFIDSFARWDTWYYLRIAAGGYGHAPPGGIAHEAAFFPLYPMLVRGVAELTGLPLLYAGLAVSWIGFALAGCSSPWGGGGSMTVNDPKHGTYTVDYLTRDGKAVLVLVGGGCRSSSQHNGRTPEGRAPLPVIGQLNAADGRKIAWRCTSRGALTIDSQSFDLAKGALFLVSPEGAKTQVEQVAVDVSELHGEGVVMKLRDLAKSEARVEAFLRSCREGK